MILRHLAETFRRQDWPIAELGDDDQIGDESRGRLGFVTIYIWASQQCEAPLILQRGHIFLTPFNGDNGPPGCGWPAGKSFITMPSSCCYPSIFTLAVPDGQRVEALLGLTNSSVVAGSVFRRQSRLGTLAAVVLVSGAALILLSGLHAGPDPLTMAGVTVFFAAYLLLTREQPGRRQAITGPGR